ncbi:MAG TPA: hypothetical protein VGJ26_01405 [Pirellulales bacterium]
MQQGSQQGSQHVGAGAQQVGSQTGAQQVGSQQVGSQQAGAQQRLRRWKALASDAEASMNPATIARIGRALRIFMGRVPSQTRNLGK